MMWILANQQAAWWDLHTSITNYT